MCFGRMIESDGNVMLCKTDKRGKCIVAERGFTKGDKLFSAPVIVFKDWETVERTELKDYYYVYDEKKELCCFVSGFASFLNHSSTPNASKSFDYEKELFICKAEKDIQKGDEIVIEYDNVWFDEQAVEAISITA